MSDIQSLFAAQRGLRMKIARALNITPGAVYQWDRVPAERVVEVERATGIPRETLRPDLFIAAKRQHRFGKSERAA